MQSDHLGPVRRDDAAGLYATHPVSVRQIVRLTTPPPCRAAVTASAIEAALALQTTIDEGPEALAAVGAKILQQHLPADLIAGLAELARPSDTTAVILRGVADLPAPDTPVHGFTDDHQMMAHDVVLAGAMKVAGTRPVAFPFENSGHIGRNVVANPAQAGMASSHGFDANLGAHQDNCGQTFEDELLPDNTLPPMPRQLGFYAIRNAEEVPTRLLLVDDLLDHVPPRRQAILSQPVYRIGAPDSVGADGFGNMCIVNAPILRFHNGYHEMRYDPLLVTTRDIAAMNAHAHLTLALEAAASCIVNVTLQSGDVLIFKNYRLLHMRDPFEPLEAAKSRWLRRFYGRSPT